MRYFQLILAREKKQLIWLRSCEGTKDECMAYASSLAAPYLRDGWSSCTLEMCEFVFRTCLSRQWREVIDPAPVISSIEQWTNPKNGVVYHRIELNSRCREREVRSMLEDMESLTCSRDEAPFLPNGFYAVDDCEFILSDSGVTRVSSIAAQAAYRAIHEASNVRLSVSERKPLMERLVDFVLGRN